MNEYQRKKLLSIFEANSIELQEEIQGLWSGYGKICRYLMEGGKVSSIITKEIDLNPVKTHPKGWNTETSHQRKLRSYQVESHWYRKWSGMIGKDIRLAKLYHAEISEQDIFLVLEDLDAAGYKRRITSPTIEEIKVVLDYLARFHASLMNEEAEGLWQEGSYWHLATRRDEWQSMEDGALKQHADQIAQKLIDAKYQTIIHGDAKLANFCFLKNGEEVAAVDFQYVGNGCGMKDVAYFLSSCGTEAWQKEETELLDFYFNALKVGLKEQKTQIDIETLELEWRELYDYAWADFIRFLIGWLPDHWKIDQHSMGYVKKVLQKME